MSDSVRFSVEGMKYKGYVVIKATLCEKCVVMLRDGTVVSCTYDTLVKTIDEKIEYSENYIEEIEKWLHIKTPK